MEASAKSPGVPANAVFVAPALAAQRGLWLAQVLRGQVTEYVITRVFGIRGPIDAEALSAAIHDVLVRHPMLSTGVMEQDGELVQFSLPPPQETLRVLYWPARGEAELSALIRETADTPFDLSRPPLLRALLVRTEPRSSTLVLCFHHIAVDEESVALITAGLSEAYAARVSGNCRGPKVVPDDLDGIASRERSRLSSNSHRNLLRDRRFTLARVPSALNLPQKGETDYGPGSEPLIHEFSVPRPEINPLFKLASDECVTPFSALLCVFSGVLHHWAFQERMIIGVPMSTRDALTKGVVGMFVNMVPLPLSFSGDPNVPELLNRVGSTVMEGFSARGLPFDELVRSLPELREPGRPAIVQAVFSHWDQSVSGRGLDIPGVRVLPEPSPPLRNEFDFSCDCYVSSDEIVFCLYSNGAAFDSRLAPSFADDLVRCLHWVSENHHARLSSWPVPGPDREHEPDEH